MKPIVWVAALSVTTFFAAYWMITSQTSTDAALASAQPSTQTSALVNIAIPTSFSTNAQTGENAFNAKCASCHAKNAVGQEGVAPPLVHIIYEPSHHGDEAFQRAAALGVRGHHWPFGDMPPVDGLTRGDVSMIVAYVRELQRANGIN